MIRYILIAEHHGIIINAQGYHTEEELWKALKGFIQTNFLSSDDSVAAFEIDPNNGNTRQIGITNDDIDSILEEMLQLRSFPDE